MAKKVKRSTSVNKPKAASQAKVTAAAPARKSSGEFNPDYSYVVKDLKRIGVLASSFFVVLIVLAIFLR